MVRPLVVILLLVVAGCGTDTRPTPPFEGPASSPAEAPTERPTSDASAQPTTEPEPRVEPIVVAQGFTADSEIGSASYAVVIENPNATWWPRFVSVSITFLDAEGTALTTETQNIAGILPDSLTAVAGEATRVSGAAAMEVQLSNLNLLPTGIRSSLAEAGRYDYEGVETAQDESGETTTTGLVLSRFDSQQINVPISVVYYDAGGAVVGGAVTQVEQLAPGGEAAFETRTSVALPDVAETRVFGQIGFGS